MSGVDLVADMARWIAETPHTRPFPRDPAFITKFGHPGRGLLRQVVDEMKNRAEQKAGAIGRPDFAALMPLIVAGEPIVFAGEPILVPETPRA